MGESEQGLHFLDYWRVISSRKEVVIAVSLLVVMTGIIITYAMPKVYMASAVIRVQESTPDVSVFTPEMMRFDPLFLRTQFELIQSRPVIEEVVRRRELDRKLSRAYGYDQLPPAVRMEQTVKLMSRWMRVQQYRDTNLIEIQVLLSEPKGEAGHEAAMTATMFAEVFREQMESRSKRSTEKALDALYEAFQEQERRLAKAEAEVERVRREEKIDVVDAMAGSRASLDKMTLQMLEELRIRASQEVAGNEARHTLVMSLADDKLVEAAQYLVNDQSIPMLVSDKRKAEVELSQLDETYGPNHPDVMRVKRVVAELEQKIKDAISGLKTGVMAEYNAAKAKLAIINTELVALREVERERESGSYQKFTEAIDARNHVKKIRDALEMRYLQEQIELRIPKTTVELVAEAKAPHADDQVSPNVALNIILSVIAGLGAGIGLAYFVEYLDTSVKTIDDIERSMNLPVLGVIPQKVLPLNEKGANPAHAESYRVLRTNIQFSQKFKDGKTLCFTSGSMGEGKSLTLFNLAFICGQLGDRTIVIDSDLHRPRQHRMFGVSNKTGLANVLIGEVDADAVIHKQVFRNVDFLPSGKLDGGVHGLLDTERMRSLIASLRDRYDRIFFDAPPVIGVSDASVIAREVDGVLLLIQHRKYPKVVSERAKGMLENMNVNLMGVALNNINVSRDQSYYYYHQYYYQSNYTTKPRGESA
jgi:capsular exopolysaccharide synthesis family protein